MCLFKTKKNGNDMPLQHTKERKKTLKLLFPAHALRPTVDDVLRSHRDESTIGLSHAPEALITTQQSASRRRRSVVSAGRRARTLPRSRTEESRRPGGTACTRLPTPTLFNSSKPGAQSRFAANNLQHQRLPVRAAP